MSEVNGEWRRYTVPALIILGSILAILSIAAVWINRRVVDTDAYVETVAPLADDPAIQGALADRLTEQLFTALDVEDRLGGALPEQISFLANPLTAELQSFVRDQTLKIFESEKFKQIWANANREAHDLVLQVLMGEQAGAVKAEGNAVVLDLGVVVDEIKTRLNENGITLFDDVNLNKSERTYTLFEVEQLTGLQKGLNLLNSLAFILPMAMVAAYATAISVSTRRWRTIIWVGVGLAAAAVFIDVVLGDLRNLYVDSVSAKAASPDAATAVFDIIVGFMKDSLGYIFISALALVAVAFLASPTKPAVLIRSTVKGWLKWARSEGESVDLGPAGAWISRQKSGLRIAGIVVALIAVILVDDPRLLTLLFIGALLAAWLGLLEIAGQKPDKEKPAD